MAEIRDFEGINTRRGKIVFISYNSVEGLASGEYAEGDVVILANDTGRAFLTKSDQTIDQKMNEKLKYDSDAVVTELKLLGIDPKKATRLQQLEALRNYANKMPGLRDEIINERDLQKRRTDQVMNRILNSAENVSANAGLAIIYAGLRVFKQAIGLAKRIRDKEIKVAILSCLCDIEEKRSMIQNKDILLLECECGGDETMGMLAKYFIANFQNKETVTETIQ